MINNDIIDNINNFLNNAFSYNETRKQLQKDSLKLRKIISKEKITDYVPYSLGYLYQLCNFDNLQFLQVLPEVFKANPAIALLYTSHARNSEKSFFYEKMNCQIIPDELTKDIVYICQCTILSNMNYCMVYIDKNIFPNYQIYDDFDSNIKQFLHVMHDKYIDKLFSVYKNNSNKLIKLFFSFYPYLDIKYINHILYIMSKMNQNNSYYNISIINILMKIDQRLQTDNLQIDFNLFHKLRSKLLLTELHN